MKEELTGTQELQIDSITGLPLLTSTYKRVEEALKTRDQIGFIYFDVVEFTEIERKYGQNIAFKLLHMLGTTLSQERGHVFRKEDMVAIAYPGSDKFIVFLFSPPRRKERFADYDLKLISYRVLQGLSGIINEKSNELGISEKIFFYSGYTIIQPNKKLNTEQLIYEAERTASLRCQIEEVMAQFVSNITHELRTPLTCIKGYVETLLEGAKDNPVICEQFLKVILEESERLNRLINDLLDLSMIEAKQIEMRIQKIEMARVIEETVSILKPYAEKNQVTINLELPKKIPIIFADEDRIRQVVINLIHNAIKYTKPGGKIDVSIKKRKIDLIVYVKDYGPGIPTRDQKNVFERFYRVEKKVTSKGGRGLGLAIAKNIIEAHGGNIGVEGKLGQGCTFHFTLPLPDEEDIETIDNEE